MHIHSIVVSIGKRRNAQYFNGVKSYKNAYTRIKRDEMIFTPMIWEVFNKKYLQIIGVKSKKDEKSYFFLFSSLPFFSTSR